MLLPENKENRIANIIIAIGGGLLALLFAISFVIFFFDMGR